MAGIFRRKLPDGKTAKKYTCWWIDEDGKSRQQAGTADKVYSLEIARKNEAQCRMIREGIISRKDVQAQDAARKPLSQHVTDYCGDLTAKGDGEKHCRHIRTTLTDLLADASITAVDEITSDKVRAALGRLIAVKGKSARTANHARGAARAFTRWLRENNRIKEDPLVLMKTAYKEEADVRYYRRDLSLPELDRLLNAAASGPDYPPILPGRRKDSRPPISGPERAMAYWIAMGTGLRAGEIASLTPESFDLGDSPTVTVRASCTKNSHEAVQPIRQDLADALRGWLAGKEPGKPVLALPKKTARMLRFDLALAGIAVATKVTEKKVGDKTIKIVDGVVDFHALRASYITHLMESGASIKTVQEMARHSDPSLTLKRYAKTDEQRKRDALKGLDGAGLHD